MLSTKVVQAGKEWLVELLFSIVANRRLQAGFTLPRSLGTCCFRKPLVGMVWKGVLGLSWELVLKCHGDTLCELGQVTLPFGMNRAHVAGL